MPLPVSLRNVAGELDIQNEEAHAYINRSTGELITIIDENIRLVERGYDPDEVSDWMNKALPKVQEVLESDDFLSLPSQWDIHEWEIMKRFCLSVEDEGHREQLLDAIHGRGAFRHFRSTVERLDRLQDWYDYRDAALKEIAAEWLEAHDIPYVSEEDE